MAINHLSELVSTKKKNLIKTLNEGNLTELVIYDTDKALRIAGEISPDGSLMFFRFLFLQSGSK